MYRRQRAQRIRWSILVGWIVNRGGGRGWDLVELRVGLVLGVFGGAVDAGRVPCVFYWVPVSFLKLTR